MGVETQVQVMNQTSSKERSAILKQLLHGSVLDEDQLKGFKKYIMPKIAQV